MKKLKIKHIFLFLIVIFIMSCKSTEKEEKKKIEKIDSPTSKNLLIHFDSIDDFVNYDPSKDTTREPNPNPEFREIVKDEAEKKEVEEDNKDKETEKEEEEEKIDVDK